MVLTSIDCVTIFAITPISFIHEEELLVMINSVGSFVSNSFIASKCCQWLKRIDTNLQINGTILFSGERYLVLSGSQNGVVTHMQDDLYLSKLTILNATERNAGLYVCSATNTFGYRFQSAYLDVRMPTS